jgi:replicative DNA helicase
MSDRILSAKKVSSVPPQDITAERALLGAILLQPTIISDVSDFIEPDTFYLPKHRNIFKQMLELFKKSEAIDLVTLSARIKAHNLEEATGGTGYLSGLTESTPTSANALHYANLIKHKHMRRNLIDAAGFIGEIAFNEQEDTETVMDSCEKKIFEVTQTTTNTQFVGIKQVLPDVWSNLEKLSANDGELRGAPTGFKSLDNILAGLQPSDLIILAARPSVGKTSLALDVARQAAVDHKVPVGIFSLEMSSQQLVDRMVSAQARVDAWKIRTGQQLSEDDFHKIRDAMDTLSKAPIFIDDRAGAQILQMRSVARRLKTEHGLGLIIVDYLQLMSTSRSHDSMVNQVTEISRSLKGLARELDVPVLALSQLSRAVESRGGKPRLSDLRDSGAIEQDADVVMFIHREDRFKEAQERTNIAEILIEKHRNGPTGMVELYFDSNKTTFLELDGSHSYEGVNQGGGENEFDEF